MSAQHDPDELVLVLRAAEWHAIEQPYHSGCYATPLVDYQRDLGEID